MERQIASRYAEALFFLAQERGEIDRVEADLKAVLALS
jgi:F0F1-type ATP synthase delta subunit